MFFANLKFSIRQLYRSKVYALVNVLGLSFALFASLLIYKYVRFERSYDKAHVDSANTYRMYRAIGDNNNYDETSIVSVFPGIAKDLEREIPGVDAVTRLIQSDKIFQSFAMTYFPAKGNPRTFNVSKGFFADQGALDIFGFDWSKNTLTPRLDEPNQVVISSSLAKKLFLDVEPVGQVIRFKNMQKDLLVTGVFDDFSANNHVHFDLLFSMSSLPSEWELDQNYGWGNFYTYVRFNEQADIVDIEAKTYQLLKDKEPWFEEENIRFKYQPIEDIHLKSQMTYELEANGNEDTLKLLELIGVLILVIAWFNYMNLSSAKLIDRTKEAGIRKALGGSSRELMSQLSVEALLVSLISIAIAVTFLQAFSVSIESLLSVPITFLSNSEWLNTIIYLGGFLLISWIIALYPSRVFAQIKATDGINGKFKSGKRGLNIRRLLTGLQFVIAMVLMISTYTVYRQLEFVQNQSLGMSIDQILVVKKPFLDSVDRATGQAAFMNSVSQMSKVKAVSAGSEIPGYEISYMRWIAKGPYEDSEALYAKDVSTDAYYDDVFELNMAYGSWYEEGMSPTSVVINEAAFKSLFGNDDPNEWINRTVYYETEPYTLIGIVKDYKQQSFKYITEPHIYTFRDRIKYFTISIQSTDIQGSINRVNADFNNNFPNSEFEYFFMDDYFNRQYKSDRLFGSIFAFFSSLAIVVVSLGLFGLTLYTLTRRTKEVSIRKVLGAGVNRICILLSREYLILLGIASFIALPLAYLFSNDWLNSFIERASLGVFHYALPIIVLSVITLITVGYQLLKLAHSNPVDHLRQDS